MHLHFERAMAIIAKPITEIPDTAEHGNFWINATRKEAAKFVFDDDLPAAVERFGLDLVNEEAAFTFPAERTWYFEWPSEGRIQSILAYERPDGSRDVECWPAGQDSDGEWTATPPFQFALAAVKEHLTKGGAFESLPNGNAIKALVSFLAILHREEIEVKKIEQPEAVNRKRIADGKAPFSAYAEVRISRWHRPH